MRHAGKWHFNYLILDDKSIQTVRMHPSYVVSAKKRGRRKQNIVTDAGTTMRDVEMTRMGLPEGASGRCSLLQAAYERQGR